jgi:hypothetical protein
MAALLQRSILPALSSLRAEHCAAPEADGLPLPEPMTTLHHYPFCPQSRFVRLILAEMGLEPTLQEERPWERRDDYLLVNPAARRRCSRRRTALRCRARSRSRNISTRRGA